MKDILYLNFKISKTSGHMSLSIKLKVRTMRGLRFYSSYQDKKVIDASRRHNTQGPEQQTRLFMAQ